MQSEIPEQKFAAHVTVTVSFQSCHVILSHFPLEIREEFKLGYQRKLPLLLVGGEGNLKVYCFTVSHSQ